MTNEELWLKACEQLRQKGLSFSLTKPVLPGKDMPVVGHYLPKFQEPSREVTAAPFFTIQNLKELEQYKMNEWIQNPQVALRVRSKEDLMAASESLSFSGRAVFLGAPHERALNEKELEVLSQCDQVNLGFSPLSFALTHGQMRKNPFHKWSEVFQSPLKELKKAHWFYLSSTPYQWAGATADFELAILLSQGVHVLTQLKHSGLTSQELRDRVSFSLSLSTDVLNESAKILALKTLWRRVCEVLLPGGDYVPCSVYGTPSLRVFSARDTWNNVIRQTLMASAAYLGGAQGFKCLPYDILKGEPTADGVRASMNIPLLLKDEGFLSQVKNPLAGSSLVSAAHESLCESAWKKFQQLEKKGGVFEAIRSGWLQESLKSYSAEEKSSVHSLSQKIVGTNSFVSFDEKSRTSIPQIKSLLDMVDPETNDHLADEMMDVEPVSISSLCEGWDRLQAASDSYYSTHGKWPEVCGLLIEGEIHQKKRKEINQLLGLVNLQCRWSSMEDITDSEKVVLVPLNQEEMTSQHLEELKEKGVSTRVIVGGQVPESLQSEMQFHKGASVLEFLGKLCKKVGV